MRLTGVKNMLLVAAFGVMVEELLRGKYRNAVIAGVMGFLIWLGGRVKF